MRNAAILAMIMFLHVSLAGCRGEKPADDEARKPPTSSKSQASEEEAPTTEQPPSKENVAGIIEAELAACVKLMQEAKSLHEKSWKVLNDPHASEAQREDALASSKGATTEKFQAAQRCLAEARPKLETALQNAGVPKPEADALLTKLLP